MVKREDLATFLTTLIKWFLREKIKWIIVDMKELSKFLLDNNTLKIHLDDLITNTDWTVFIPKNKP